jgi:sugar phosphate isomerase/epimerase
MFTWLVSTVIDAQSFGMNTANEAMAPLGIETISVFGLPPIEFVNLAADLGCQHISTGLMSYDFGVCDYTPYSLRDDASLRREMVAVMRDRGVSISLGEGLTIRPHIGAKDYQADLDILCELGVKRINTISIDPDRHRTFDEFAILAEMAAMRGLETTTELVPSLTVGDLPTALAAVRHVGRPDFRLLIDTMHVIRSGTSVADIAALDPQLIAYVQLCDAPREPRLQSYFEEAMFERLAPGTGELGLRELVTVLPRNRVYSLEVPMRSEAKAGIGPHERLRKCVEAARKLLIEAERSAGR